MSVVKRDDVISPNLTQKLKHVQLTAKLVQVLPLQTGSSKNGEWKKQDIIVETDGQYPKKVCISIWGDKINASQLQIGKMLNISFDIESREYNSRWYTDVKAWKVEAASTGSEQGASAGDDMHNTTFTSDDDLPF